MKICDLKNSLLAIFSQTNKNKKMAKASNGSIRLGL